MSWKAEQARASANPRTYVLGALLVLALAWAVGEKTAPKRRPSAASSAAAILDTSAPMTEPTPDGWGRDPFDPRAVSADRANGR